MSIVGLDIGTTGVKAVVFREDGTFLTAPYREYDLESPKHGHLELNPNEVLDAVREVLGKAAADAIKFTVEAEKAGASSAMAFFSRNFNVFAQISIIQQISLYRNELRLQLKRRGELGTSPAHSISLYAVDN